MDQQLFPQAETNNGGLMITYIEQKKIGLMLYPTKGKKSVYLARTS
jgi:hypothetical protein